MNVLFSLTKNTFRESIRDRILSLIFFFGFLFLVAVPLAGPLAAGQEERIIANFGLAMIQIFGLFVTIFVGSRLIFNEVEKKTIFLLLPKPVKRSTLIVSKFFGLAAVLLCTTAAMSMVYFLIAPFSAEILLTIALFYLSFLLLLAIILFFSAFMSPLVASVSGILMFLVGNITFSFKLLIEQNGSQLLQIIANMTYHLLPNFSHLNLKTYVVYQIPYTGADILWVCLVTVLFILIFLWCAVEIFKRKEFE